MRRFAFLFGTALLLGAAPALAQSSSVTVSPNGSLSSTTTLPGSPAAKDRHTSDVRPSDEPCRVVGSDGRARNGSTSSTVTAGPNGVHSYSSGGPSVTVRSKDGRSVSSSSASSSGGTTVVTGSGSGGDCTVTVNPTDRNIGDE